MTTEGAAGANRGGARSGGARALAVATMLLGAGMAGAPAVVGRWSAGPGDPPPPVIVRILGAREVLQGVAVAVRPSRTVIGAGILVDVAHAATMVAGAVLLPRYRRPTVLSGLLALASAVAGAVVRRSTPRAPSRSAGSC